MLKKIAVCLSIPILLFLSAGPVCAADQPAPLKEMLQKAREGLMTVPTEHVMAAADRKEQIVILDVREPHEFAAGHLPGAINIPRGLLEFKVFTVIPDRNTKICVYCKSGGRSTLGAKTLVDLGYSNAGLSAVHYVTWVKSGYFVER